MSIYKKIFSSLIMVCVASAASANSGFEEYFYESGKFKVVVAVAGVILAGIITFLIIIDRKIKKLEKRAEQ